MTDTHLEQFFANTRKMKAEVEGNPQLLATIKDILHTEYTTAQGASARYTQLQPSRLGLKRRGNIGMIELALMADLYTPEIPVSPFGVFISEELSPEKYRLAYLVQDFGTVYPLREEAPEFSRPETRIILEHITSKGYHFVEPENAFGFTQEGLVLHDLDPKAMSFVESSEVIKGTIAGEGRFARLAAIYERFKQLEYRLKLS